jgi:hypothetical protein
MPTLTIESNGRIERTAIYYNGEQLGGIKELLVHIDEDGTFDDLIQYTGTDKQVYTKRIFSDYLTNIKTVEPSFTEDEAKLLKMFTVESDGDINDTYIYENEEDEPLGGIVSVFIHIKAAASEKSGFASIFSANKKLIETVNFATEIKFRENDYSTTTESIF